MLFFSAGKRHLPAGKSLGAYLFAVLFLFSAASARADVESYPAERLTPLLRQALVRALPPGAKITSIYVGSPVALERGLPHVEVLEAESWPIGQPRAAGRAELTTRRGSRVFGPVSFSFQASVDAVAQVSKIPVMARGAQVQVRVVTGNVLLVALGTTQEPASLGDSVRVLPEHGGKVLMGTVINASTVEVRL